jgi:plasmid stabilization system protein ParE
MNSGSFSFHPDAIEEAWLAARWYRERSPIAARRFVSELNEVIDKIVEAPKRWPPSRHAKDKAPLFPVFGDLS